MQIELTFHIVDPTVMEQRFYDVDGKLIDIRRHRAPRQTTVFGPMRESRRIFKGSPSGGFIGNNLNLDANGD